MVLCPIAVAVGCAKCPVVRICPLKTVIGDYRPATPAEAQRESPAPGGEAKRPRRSAAAKKKSTAAKPAASKSGRRGKRRQP